VGLTGIGVGLGSGDVLVGPSFAALIVGSNVCGEGDWDVEEHAEHRSSTIQKVHRHLDNLREH